MLSAQGLLQRSLLLQRIRSFFLERAYIEVDTPIRLPTLLPEANILPFTSEGWYLQPSPEICMKRLLARGCPRIFQICHCFRREEHGRLHQPEFTLLEWYQQGWEYRQLMGECEDLLAALCEAHGDFPALDPGGRLLRHGEAISLRAPWDRLTVEEAFARHASLSLGEALEKGCFDETLVTEVEPHLGRERPLFLCDYPVELGSLARRSPCKPDVAERFELYIAGLELANGFSELTDPDEQRSRFAGELQEMAADGRPSAMPESFLADLGLLGETAGIALGLDRLFMLLVGGEEIGAAMPFAADEL